MRRWCFGGITERLRLGTKRERILGGFWATRRRGVSRDLSRACSQVQWFLVSSRSVLRVECATRSTLGTRHQGLRDIPANFTSPPTIFCEISAQSQLNLSVKLRLKMSLASVRFLQQTEQGKTPPASAGLFAFRIFCFTNFTCPYFPVGSGRVRRPIHRFADIVTSIAALATSQVPSCAGEYRVSQQPFLKSAQRLNENSSSQSLRRRSARRIRW